MESMDSSEHILTTVEAPQNINPTAPPKKVSRKSRSKGLRCKTGCITCRKRHKKCDETLPRCGSCIISDRSCIWPNQIQSTADRAQEQPGQVDRISTYSDSNSHERLQPSTPQEAFSTVEFAPPAYSPANTVSSDFLTADLASVRWLDLLAADAIQANRGFSRAASPTVVSGQATPSRTSAVEGLVNTLEVDPSLPQTNARLNGLEAHSWQLDHDIVLKDFETAIFRNFVDHASLWLDLFDPDKHFSIYSTRLAIRNIGLMKAILALSAQHLSRQGSGPGSNLVNDPNLAVEYYYETLHYVQTALQFNSYAHSEELLATALVISTYEMLDESDSGWQRHLKGVFWIQRSQNVDGGSGGIRQAVWWAWLRQDIWAAFRERRRCLSFWKPVKDHAEQNITELANSATYLLSQAVNYCAEPDDSSAIATQRRIDTADELLAKMDRWKSFLSSEFTPLPMSHQPTQIFQPIWIHPPKFGVALQVFYFARILIMLHRPAMPGFKSYLKVQKTLSEAVAVICGIAMELKDEGCQIVSAQCLYGAGLCVQEDAQRNEIISLINLCEARTGWPMSTMREDLFKEWRKIDSDEVDRKDPI